MAKRLKLVDASDFLNTVIFCGIVGLTSIAGQPAEQIWRQLGAATAADQAAAPTHAAARPVSPTQPNLSGTPGTPASVTALVENAVPSGGDIPPLARLRLEPLLAPAAAAGAALALEKQARAQPSVDAYVPPLRKRAPATPAGARDAAPAVAALAPKLIVPAPVPAVRKSPATQTAGVTVKGRAVPTATKANKATTVASGQPIDLSGRSALGAGPGLGLKCNKGLVYNPKSLMCVPIGQASAAPPRGQTTAQRTKR